jgi:hypothetical protein
VEPERNTTRHEVLNKETGACRPSLVGCRRLPRLVGDSLRMTSRALALTMHRNMDMFDGLPLSARFGRGRLR